MNFLTKIANFVLHGTLEQAVRVVISALISAIVVYALLSKKRSIIWIVLIFLIVIVASVAFMQRDLIYGIRADSWMHISLTERTLEKGLFPGDPFYKNFPTPPHYSLMDVIHSTLSFITGIRVHVLWGKTSPFFAALICLTIFWWAKELTRDVKIGLMAMIFLLSTTSYILSTTSYTWYDSAIPKSAGIIFYALTHIFYFRSQRNRKMQDAILSGVFFGLSITVHLFVGVATLFSLLSYNMLKFVVDKARGRSLRQFISDARFIFIPVGFMVASPWLIVYSHRYFTNELFLSPHSYASDQDTLVGTIGGMDLISFSRGLFFSQYHTLLWVLAAIGLCICLYKVIRHTSEDFHIFLIATTITTILILLTPLYMISVKIFGPGASPRFIIVLPVYILSALAIRHILSISTKERFRIFKNTVVVGALFLLLVILFKNTAWRTMDLLENQKSLVTPLNGWDADFDKIKKMVKGKIVLSDMWTSYFLPYYTGAYVVAIVPIHGSQFINHEKRVADVASILNPGISTDSLMKLLRKYEVEYVLLNLRPILNPNFSSFSMIASQYPDGVSEIFKNNPFMHLVYYNDGVWLYQLSFDDTVRLK